MALSARRTDQRARSASAPGDEGFPKGAYDRSLLVRATDAKPTDLVRVQHQATRIIEPDPPKAPLNQPAGT